MSERVESVYIFCFKFYVILVLCHRFISDEGKPVSSACFWALKREFMFKNKSIGSAIFLNCK